MRVDLSVRRGLTTAFLLLSFLSLMLASSAAANQLSRPAGAKKELLNRRTSTETAWLMRDGSTVTDVSGAPVRWRWHRRWRAIDLRFQQTDRTGVRLGVDVDGGTVTLPRRLGGTGLSARSAAGDWLKLGLIGARPTTARFTTSTARYRSALPGIDVRMTAVPQGMKEDLVLASRRSASTISYTLQLSSGLKPRVSSSGALLAQRDGDNVFALPRPNIHDAGGAAHDGPDPRYILTARGDQTWRLDVVVDRLWLADGHRRWPVTLDPTTYLTWNASATRECSFSVGGNDGDCASQGADPHARLRVGAFDNVAGSTAYLTPVNSLISFPNISGPIGLHDAIDSAQLLLTVTAQNQVSNQGVRVSPVTGTWRADETLNFTTAPAISADPGATGSYPKPTLGSQVSINVLGAVEAWQRSLNGEAGGIPQYGLRLYADTPSGTTPVTSCAASDLVSCPRGFTQFAASNSTTPPVLRIVSWPTAPGGAAVTSPTEGTNVQRRVTLTAHAPTASVNAVRFQYIAGDHRTWQDVPLAALRYPGGSAPSSTSIPASAGGGGVTGGVDSRAVVWDLQSTPGAEIDGSIHVRALFDDPTVVGGGVSRPVNFRIDRRDTEKSSTEDIGPGQVDLLSGDFTLTSTDVDEKAWLTPLSLSRTSTRAT
jgi:hypothetical protein